ncbi:MAG: hypothetical protein AABY06_03540 [Nanoarchaeota archaeon]
MERKSIFTYSIILLLLGGFLIFLYFAQGKITGFSVYEQSSQSDFNLGNYSNTLWNGSAVVLNSGQTSGNYTSKIFDAGINSTWNNLSWVGGLPNINFIFATDNQADVWKSVDSGTIWSLVKDDYNGAEGNGVTASFADSSKNFYIIKDQEVWKSTDFGITWTKINSNYNGAEGQNAFVATADKNNNFFVIEGDQDVWKSSDSGLIFTKTTTDFNGGNGNFFGLISDSNNNLYSVDAQADVWKSSDSGVSWSLVKDDYNVGEGNNADGMTIDSNNILYVLDSQDVWKSSDSGISWTKINDDFNGAGDSENSKSIIIDLNNYIYVIDGGEDVFRSTDSGSTFTKTATNFNGANGITSTMAVIVRQTNLSFQTRNCFSSDCSDGIWQNADLNNLNFYGRYFQYSVNFSTPDSGTTPYLKSVSIDYAINNSAPSLSISSPNSASIYSNTNISLNFLVSDLENNLGSCWYEFEGVNRSLSNCVNTSFIVSGSGNYNLVVYANDSFNYLNSSTINFMIDIISPNVTINSPSATTYTTSTILFNATSIDATTSVSSCWYTLNSGTTNQTLSKAGTSNYYNFTQTSITDGSYTARFYCNDSANNINNTENVLFIIDSSISEISSGSSGESGGGGSSSSKKLNSSKTEILENNKTSNVQNFSNNLISEQIEISLINVDRRKYFVDAEYSVKNLAEEDKDINLYFSILDSNETIKSEIEESHTIFANSEKTIGTTIPIDKNLNEELILIIDFKKYSSSVSESAPVRSPISGFSILPSEKDKNNLFAIIALSLLSFVFVLFAIYKIIKNRKMGFSFRKWVSFLKKETTMVEKLK